MEVRVHNATLSSMGDKTALHCHIHCGHLGVHCLTLAVQVWCSSEGFKRRPGKHSLLPTSAGPDSPTDIQDDSMGHPDADLQEKGAQAQMPQGSHLQPFFQNEVSVLLITFRPLALKKTSICKQCKM